MNELKSSGINLIMVSIGTPENGKKLVDHLSIPNLADYLYVDPNNTLYDSLNLNKGVKSLVLPGTAFAFLKRFIEPDGTKELYEVLTKWNNAIYMPPRKDQAFNQGGTFLFDGEQTIYAHYDESTGAHCDIQEVIDLANERVNIHQQISL